MNLEQISVVAILLAALFFFARGRWRHDVVAVGALLACVLAGLVPEAEVFSGFGHPAVITVAAVLLLSHGLQASGAVDLLVRKILPSACGALAGTAILALLAVFLSAFMNNVGALALLMPVALQFAARREIPAGRILMPISFASILGGTTTLIGTPPNIIVSGFRGEVGPAGFTMFDFSPVGLAVALAGLVFIVLAGWRLVPARSGPGKGFDTARYLTEVGVPSGSPVSGRTIGELEKGLEELGAQVISMVRRGVRIMAPNRRRLLRDEDVLVIEAEPDSLAPMISSLGLRLEEGVAPARDGVAGEDSGEGESGGRRVGRQENGERPADASLFELAELVVLPTSRLAGRSARDIDLRNRYGLNLLGVSRQGRRSMSRLSTFRFKPGDVLLMQGVPEAISDFAAGFGCLPLADRGLGIPDRKKALLAGLVMLLAVAAVSLGFLPASVSFAAGAFAMVILRIFPIRAIYEEIDWPVIVLLGAMFPLAGALASTGTADLAARFAVASLARGNPVALLVIVLVVTMTLSDFMNNAATAAIMCPIALGMAARAGVNPDSLLMAVALGASCAFLTPIGHQNNTLILGPGGFRFGDYWRLGLPLEVIVILAGVPAIMVAWPLGG